MLKTRGDADMMLKTRGDADMQMCKNSVKNRGKQRKFSDMHKNRGTSA
jgi:hypothetical protein